MSFELTTAGLSIERLDEIKTALEAAFRASFGDAVNLDPATPEGQLIGVMAEREALIQEAIEFDYNSKSPDTAAGTSLDMIGAINNVRRLPPVPSSFTVAGGNTVTVTGTPGTTIPAGFRASIPDNTVAVFETAESFVVEGGGTVEVEMFCTYEDPAVGIAGGPVACLAGTLTSILTQVSGISAVTNSEDATLGRLVETDAEYRLRRLQSLTRAGSSVVDGIYTAVSGLAGVFGTKVYENTDDVPDIGGRPPHSFEVVVQGGTDQVIADTIWASKPAGIATYGNTSATVQDSQGSSHTVYFSRPVLVPLYVKAVIVPNTAAGEGPLYPVDGDAAVAAAILAFGQQAVVGHDVIINQFYTPINTVDGVFGVTLYIDTVNPPTNQANLPIGPQDLASYDSGRITVES